MQNAIMYYFVYELTYDPLTKKGDPLALGMLGLWEVIPAIGFSLFSGHFVDLKEKRTMIEKCIIGYLLLSAFFVFLAWPTLPGYISKQSILWLVYASIFTGGALRAFLSPSSFALQGMLVPRELYPNATTWSSTAWQMGFVIGPLLGGFMMLLGYHVAIMSVVVIEVISLISLMRIPRQPILNKEKEPIFKSLSGGLKFVFSTQLVLAALSLDMFAVLFGGAVALLPIYANDILHVGPVGYGWMKTAPGIGAVITLFIVSIAPLKRKLGIKLLVSIAGFGITTVIFGYCGNFGTTPFVSFFGFNLSWGFIVAVSMLLLGGMLDAVNVVIRHTILQVHTPDSMRGRVAAVNTMFISSSNELGAMESGLTAKWMGTVPAVVFGGCMTLVVVGVTYFAAPLLRKLNTHDEHKKAGE